jgi:TIR domain-containing protein
VGKAPPIRYYRGVTKSPANVFISYSKDAKQWAEKLYDSLESKGVPAWTDFKSIKPGQRWRVEIQRALDDAKYFLLVVGPKNDIGEWQDREWQGALQRTWTDPNKRIIPVLIDNSSPPSFLKDWGGIRVQPGQPESSWIDTIYDTVRGADSAKRSATAKQSAKPNKALQSRLAEIEGAVRQLKSSQEE